MAGDIDDATVDFGGGPLTSAGHTDIFIAKFDSSGSHIWSRRFGGPVYENAWGIEFDPKDDYVFVAGSFRDTLDFGGKPLVNVHDWDDVYLVKFDPTGNHVWSQSWGDSAGQTILGLDFNSGYLSITGQNQGIIDFGGGNLVTAGGQDFYAAQFRYSDEPFITGIEDIGNDQGKQVRISFIGSSLDSLNSSTPIMQYEAFRRIDALPAMTSDADEGRWSLPPMVSDAVPSLGEWDYVGAVPAHGEIEYNIIVPTLADSTISNGMHWSVYFIRAATASPALYFDSAPDSGYSLDNLAPFVPQGMVVAYNTGSGNELSWDESLDEDFQYFRIYRGTDPDFTPSEVNLVHSTVSTEWNDPEYDGWMVYYKVTAVDFSGNESDPASPKTTTGIGEKIFPRKFALYQNVPNPFNPSTVIKYDVPEAIRVRITIYDVSGREARTLVDEFKTPGTYEASWNGLNNSSEQMSSGVYLYKIEAGDYVQSRKLVLLK
jgi:hypothetical protein